MSEGLGPKQAAAVGFSNLVLALWAIFAIFAGPLGILFGGGDFWYWLAGVASGYVVFRGLLTGEWLLAKTDVMLAKKEAKLWRERAHEVCYQLDLHKQAADNYNDAVYTSFFEQYCVESGFEGITSVVISTRNMVFKIGDENLLVPVNITHPRELSLTVLPGKLDEAYNVWRKRRRSESGELN